MGKPPTSCGPIFAKAQCWRGRWLSPIDDRYVVLSNTDDAIALGLFLANADGQGVRGRQRCQSPYPTEPQSGKLGASDNEAERYKTQTHKRRVVMTKNALGTKWILIYLLLLAAMLLPANSYAQTGFIKDDAYTQASTPNQNFDPNANLRVGSGINSYLSQI